MFSKISQFYLFFLADHDYFGMNIAELNFDSMFKNSTSFTDLIN